MRMPYEGGLEEDLDSSSSRRSRGNHTARIAPFGSANRHVAPQATASVESVGKPPGPRRPPAPARRRRPVSYIHEPPYVSHSLGCRGTAARYLRRCPTPPQ